MGEAKEIKININNSDAQSQIMGVLVNGGFSAKEAIVVLDAVKETFLSRSYHVN